VSRPVRLLLALLLNLILVGALVVVGRSAHSLGVIAAGGDYLADAVGIGVAILAYPLARRFPRMHSIAALVNGGWLLLLSVLVAAAALSRLVSGTPEVHGLPVVIASTIAMIVMLIVALVLRVDLDDDDDDVHEQLSSRAVLLDTLADAAAAAGVAIAGGIILATHSLYWLDPTIALFIAAVIGFHAFQLLRDVRLALRR
jgi:cobalt-zinc-cadmium efflux system protein